MLCHFVQKNAKWVEVQRTLEYYAGPSIDITSPEPIAVTTMPTASASEDGNIYQLESIEEIITHHRSERHKNEGRITTGIYVGTLTIRVFNVATKASFLGGSFSTNVLMRPTIDYPNLFSNDLTISDSLIVKGGSDSSNLEEKDKTTYLFNDVYVEIR